MDGPVRISFLVVIASGALALGILSFTGAVWPYAETDEARAHLAFSNAATFVTFLCALLVFAAGALVSLAARTDWHSGACNALSSLIFLVGLIVAGIQVSEAMNAWFDAPPRMGEGLIMLVRTGTLIALGWLVLSLGLAGWLALKKRGAGEANEK